MKKKRNAQILCLLLLVLSLVCSSCSTKEPEANPNESGSEVVGAEKTVQILDWTGHEENFSACPKRVVAVSGSLGEVWLNAGGTLIGTTQDAITERNLDLPEETAMIGTIKEPDLEVILSLEPDFVILSADIISHQDLAKSLQEMGIPYGLFHEEYFQDYLTLLEQFTSLTGRTDLYESNGLEVERDIQQTLAQTQSLEDKTVLLLRAYSSGFKAKNSENLTGTMLKDFGLQNILDVYDSILEEISMEEILRVDPDYIFVTVMGSDTQAGIDYLESQLCEDPAWSTLTAVKEGNYHVLPKDLFHYKPNARWNEAYAYLAQRLDGSEMQIDGLASEPDT
ncbi:MAG: ABC transporter substrate-binding protein [Lawsonibacter sp.]